MKNVMCISAHPDDGEWCMGGVLLKHKQKADKITMVVMTNTKSISGITKKKLRTKRQLKKETKASAKILNANLEFLPFKDLHVPFDFKSVSLLEKLIIKYNIDTIYVHWSGDTNQDHVNTLKTAMAAGRLIPNVLCYEQVPLPRITNIYPTANYYVDITDVFSQKMELVKCHQSQLKKYSSQGFDIIKGLETLAKYRGAQIGVKYAEAFDILKMVGME